MDMTISIDENGTVITDLYKKPLALYLYIPPKSAHAPGVFKGLVFGQLLRIFYLCSRLPDIQRHIKDFYDRLKNRGYSHNDILPIFERAAEHAENFLLLTPDDKKQKREQKKCSNARKLFLHLPYHPHDPPSSILQRLFREHILFLADETPFFEVDIGNNAPVDIDGMITCYHRHPNLGNIFSVRKLCKKEGSRAAEQWRLRFPLS